VSGVNIASIFRGEGQRKNPRAKNQREQRAGFSLVDCFFYREDEGDAFLRNIDLHKIYTVPYPRRQHSS
jgi:hypothetical protein